MVRLTLTEEGQSSLKFGDQAVQFLLFGENQGPLGGLDGLSEVVDALKTYLMTGRLPALPV